MPFNYTPKDVDRFWSKVDTSGDCWLWISTRMHQGYGVFSLNGKFIRAHRLSYTIANGPFPDELLVCHRCDNPQCVRPDHLFLGNHKDNNGDMKRKGRSATGQRNGKYTKPERTPRGADHGLVKDPSRAARGEANGFARLTAPQVVEIRTRYSAGGVTLSELGIEHHVSVATIHLVVTRKGWKHIP